MIRRWRQDERGGLSTIFALMAPALVVASVGGLDLTSMVRAKSKLQQAVDAAALATASQSRVNTVDAAAAQGIASRVVAQLLNNPAGLSVTAAAPDGTRFTVTATQKLSTISGQWIGSPFDMASATATATLAGTTKVCVVGLDSSNMSQQLLLSDTGTIQANGCSVIANSTSSSDAILVKDSASLTASMVGTQGKASVQGASAKMSPAAIKTKKLDNPITQAEPVKPTNCTYGVTSIAGNGNKNMSPGKYCGPVTLAGNATVTLYSGTYVFTRSLTITGNVKVTGDNVVLVFASDSQDGGLTIDGNATVELSGGSSTSDAPGVLIWQHSSLAGKSATFQFKSPNINKLTGIVYIPSFPLTVTVNNNKGLALQSPWTALLVKSLQVQDKGRIVLNADYSAAPDVPAPTGLKASTVAAQPVLTN